MALQVTQVAGPVIPKEIEKQLLSVEMLKTVDLIIDNKFQREKDSLRVNKMSKEWNWNACGTLAVSLRKQGRKSVYSVIDGQQRLGAITLLGYTEAPCHIYIDLTEIQEAELFELLNHGKQPTFNDLFKSRLLRREEISNNIRLAVEGVGYKLDPERKHRNWRYIQTMTELERIFKLGKSMLIMDTLRFLEKTFPEDLGYQQMILAGIAQFLMKYGNVVNMNQMSEKMVRIGQLKMTQNAFQYLSARGRSGSGNRALAYSEAMLLLYNNGRQEANRIPSKQS